MKRIVYTLFMMLMAVWHATAQVTPGKNILCVDVTLSQNISYDSAFNACKSLGMKQMGLFFTWTSIETSPGVFDFSYLDIANVYYPVYNTSVDLTIAPIATNHLEVPSDLATYSLDDPRVVARFKTLLDSIFVHIPSLQLSSLEIGSEMDVYLGSSAPQWAQYTTFYAAVAAHAKTLRSNLKVASEATFDGLTGHAATYLQTLNAYSDYIAISYYPLNPDFTVKPIASISTDFAKIIALYPSKPLYFTQYGYPSSAACNSSNALQSQFVQQTFTSWDEYADHIKMIDFTWMHDLSEASLDYYSQYYGISDKKFLGFLGSLGLRTYSGKGTTKPAYDELICQANQRGYNSLTCVTETNDIVQENDFMIFPNPASATLYLQRNNHAHALSDIKIINSLEQEVYHEEVVGHEAMLDISQLAAGIYFVCASTDKGTEYMQKIVVAK